MLRPVVHAFVRGVGGAVVTFPPEMEGPRLWLSAEDEVGDEGDDTLWRLPVLTCNTCGQHYFVHHVADLQVTRQGLQGGEAVEDRRVWRALDATQGGTRVVLLDHLIGAEDGDDDPVHTRRSLSAGSVVPSIHTRWRAVMPVVVRVLWYASWPWSRRPTPQGC